MIINLIGPPGVGKSTFASRFVLEHPYYSYHSIDAYRVSTWKEGLSGSENDRNAWKMLYHGVYYSRDSVLESVGLDWRLEKIFQKIQQPRINIAFVGQGKDIEERLRNRQHKRRLPLPYEPQDEIDTIYYVLEELSQDKVPVDVYIDTTGKGQEEIYKIVTAQIANFRISHFG